MDVALEALRHLLSNDHGELTALAAWLADNSVWLRLLLDRLRGGRVVVDK